MNNALAHWHPVLADDALGSTPRAVKVLGTEIVLFRTRDGVAALRDRCPHRGVRLSTGHVENDSVVCPYHLWSFGRSGQGRSPCNPKMRPCTDAYQTAVQHGLIWIREGRDHRPLPEMDVDGFNLVIRFHDTWEAAYELVFDNIAEVEHAPTNHFMFAFDANCLETFKPEYAFEPDVIRMLWDGRQRPVPLWASKLTPLDVKPGYRLTIDVQCEFAPVRFTLDHVWRNSEGREVERLREFVFLTPIDEENTAVFVAFYTRNRFFSDKNPIKPVALKVLRPIMQREIDSDRAMVKLQMQSTKSASLKGFQLGVHDRALNAARERMERIYLTGRSPGSPATSETTTEAIARATALGSTSIRA